MRPASWNLFVLGSNSSEVDTGSQQIRETPPASSTCPFDRSVAVWSWRGTRILPTMAKLPAVAMIVRAIVLEAPPPGAGLNTVTWALPDVAMSLAGMAAVSWVLLTKVVGRSDPFQRTAELEMKFVPLTIRVKADPPPATVDGDSAAI